MNIREVMSLCYLLVNSVTDLIWRRVLLGCSIVGIVAGIGIQIWRKELEWQDFGMGILLGIIVMCLAWVTNGRIGMGDGIAVLLNGILLGGKVTASIFIVAVYLAGILALLLLCLRKKSRDYSLPFIPFLALGFVATKLLSYLEATQ